MIELVMFPEISGGREEASYSAGGLAPVLGSGIGIGYDTKGQYGNACTNEHVCSNWADLVRMYIGPLTLGPCVVQTV